MDLIKFGLVFEADKAFRTFSRLSGEAREFSSVLSATSDDIDRFEGKLSEVSTEAIKADKHLEDFTQGLEELQKEGKETGSILGELKEKFEAIAGVSIGGLSFGSIVKDVLDAEGVARRIVANTTLGWERAYKLKRDILDLYKETGASEEEIEETIQNIVQQYGKWDDEAKKAAETALKLSKITKGKYEPTELIHAAMQLKRSFGDVKSLDEAFQHLYVILQNSGDAAGDLLDVIREYSPLLGESGLKAKEFAAVLIEGAKAGAYNYDKIADMLKEGFKAGLAEGSNLQDLMQKLTNIQQQYGDLIGKTISPDAWIKLKSAFVDYISAVQSGNKELQKESFMRITGLFAVLYKKNKLVAKELMQQVFGTIGTEDLAIKVVEAISKALEKQEEFYKNAKSIDESYRNMASTWDRFEKAVRTVKTELAVALTPLVDKFAWGLEKIAGFIEEHSTLTATLVGTAGALVTLGGAVKLLGGAFGLAKTGLSAILSPLGIFKKELSSTCGETPCVSNLKEEFKGLGKTIEWAKGKFSRFRGLLSKPLSLGSKLLSPITGKGGTLTHLGGSLLSKLGGFIGRFGLKGLARVGLNLLGPVGWAVNAGLMAWDVWNLVKDTGIGKAIAKGVGKAWEFAKGVGKSVWGGIKSFFGIGEKVSKPVAEKDSLIHKVAEVSKTVSPVGGAVALAHTIGGWFSHLFGGEEKKEPPKEVKHFEKLHKEVETVKESQKVETVKEGSPPIEVKPNITFNVNINSSEPQKVKEEILRTLERLTPDVLEWLERALNELRHRNAPVY